MSGERQRAHEAFTAGYVERMIIGPEARGNYRGGLDSAACLADAIAADLQSEGRPSKRRSEMVALAKRIGDAIDRMRERIQVSP